MKVFDRRLAERFRVGIHLRFRLRESLLFEQTLVPCEPVFAAMEEQSWPIKMKTQRMKK